MTIECYYTACPFHSAHQPDGEGPFCDEEDCRATAVQRHHYDKIRSLYLYHLKKRMDEYDDFVVQQKRIWFGKLWWWRFNKAIKNIMKGNIWS